jgi:putative FmdB family regulatory protein|uniref:Zinc ribbon domain-containing protein n=1 Tax=Desulfomonile tiedjei TaxID=2358 RepID=A0A7C4EUC5_9BACT
MPIYEFKCSNCGKEFERLMFASDHSQPECPVCGSTDTSKILSVFSCTGLDAQAQSSCGKTSGGFS